MTARTGLESIWHHLQHNVIVLCITLLLRNVGRKNFYLQL